MAYVSTTHDRYLGKSVGTGHCVPFVREACGAPHTSHWKQGELVRTSQCIKGTAIATFDPGGIYGNHTDGRSHAAILLAINSDGLLVMDCWLGQLIQQRTIRYRNGIGDPVNDGDAFYVIE
jgi:hypothetical protein